MYLRRLILFLALVGVLSACGNDILSPEGFLLPGFRAVSAEGAGMRFTLIAELSSPRVDACGFILTLPSGETVRLDGSLENLTFSASPKRLQPNQEYVFKAFACAGQREILSEEYTFSTGTDNGIVYIGDEAFLAYLLTYFDTNGDGYLQVEEAAAIRTITLGPRGIRSLQGIEYMPNLQRLDCSGNLINEIDISANPGLTWIDCAPMDDDAHNNLLEVLYIGDATDALKEIMLGVENMPEETIICKRYDTDPRVGMLVDAGGAKGVVFMVDDLQNEALLVSVDEIFGRDWKASVRWCESYGDGSWGMPDIDGLQLLHQAFYPVSHALKAGGFSPLNNQNYCYWSCTFNPESNSYLYRMRLWDGCLFTNLGSDEHIYSGANFTRAVRRVSL